MSHWDEDFLAIVVGGISVIAFFLTILLSIIVIQMRKSYLAQREWSFKQELLGQGLSVEEIERLLNAGHPPGSLARQGHPALSETIAGPGAPDVTQGWNTNPPRLYRSTRDCHVAGVLGGMAEYFSVDPTLVRVLFVLAVLVTGIFPLVVAYGVMAVVMPRDPAWQAS
ncbi:MAG: PspC domain-containing protein [Planctomycetota bacterium]